MTDAALAWAARAAGPIERVTPLPGGTHALTYLLRTADRELVLRCFPAGDPAAGNEAAVLTTLAGLDGWAP
jgi:hypothetical protein